MAKAKNTDKLVVQNAAKTLLANIRFASVDDPIRTITVTSSIPNEGKSTVSINLAQAIATSGKSVLLVEADMRRRSLSDMRRRSLSDMLGVRSRGGLYAVLSEQISIDQAIVETGQKNFYFLDAEPHIPNPADIIVSHRFAKLVKALSAKFQYVIFDAPPVGTFIDAAEIASLTDGTLFVVREDFTKREEALNAIGQLKKSEKVKLIGTVMNYCETETSEYYYSYYTKDGKKVKKGSDDQGTSKKGIFTNRANV
ncbi:CpsD/CapB family tyrosine-protein kinase [Collinsella aerofaciens]|uniref:non-specific protein-tyrosine kinase n=1 Tax=Collinsella aerofaciens TaxID=74426 RepID=A0A5K1IPG4_9ACTN|nr:CpsD/CapB family tyrosine-protein kinase [Collinsella aerofaciens]VWL89867.1 Tyrosine-protein kinase YwqD [Collinsella aerofaciens]